jgi:OmpA-OmpF porin, OOP family
MSTKLCIAVTASVAMLVFTSVSFAQASPTAPDADKENMPFEGGFWGHTGLSLGSAKLHAPCPAAVSCDLRDNSAWRAFVGRKLNNTVRAEAGVVDLGDFNRGGGSTTTRGIDLALVAGMPIGERSSVFGKIGGAYMRTNVSGTGLTSGRESGWGPRIGIGAQIGLTQDWALRLDADRYRVDLPGSRQSIDTYMAGAQYSFR